MNVRDVPRHLDQPQRLLGMSVDELIPLGFLFVIGIAIGHLGKCLLIGLVMLWALRRYQTNKPHGYMVHMLYWYGIAPVPFRTALNPYLRRLLPA